MFKRLLREGWYERREAISKLQKLATEITAARSLPRNTPLDQLELISIDFEATGNGSGKFAGNPRVFQAGFGEIIQIGYTVHRGDKIVERVSLPVRPTIGVSRVTTKITGLSANDLRDAPRFEAVLGPLLEAIKGRVIVGQSFLGQDASWLRANAARLGVDLPALRRMVLDTHLLSYNSYPKGAGVKTMSTDFGLTAEGRLHDAATDAELTGQIFYRLMKNANAKTLGDALDLQQKGYLASHPRMLRLRAERRHRAQHSRGAPGATAGAGE